MLKIFKELEPFFVDNYRRINIREYARIVKVSPPTASKILNNLFKEDLLKKEEYRGFIFYFANKENNIFISLQNIYYNLKFKDIGLIDYLEKNLVNPLIILFGSFSKGEINENSDIDIAILNYSKKTLDLSKFETKLKREVHLFYFKDVSKVQKSPELFNNILNGKKLAGEW